MSSKTMRWILAAGAAAAVTAAVPARASRDSGGPGALGTEVPFDSRVARQYFNYYLPTDTPEALRIRDGAQKLHADHQAALALAQAGASSQSAEVRRFAQELGARLAIIDGTLVDVARDSLLELSGPAYEQQQQASAEVVRGAQGAAAPERDTRVRAGVVQVLEAALATVDDLRPQARKAMRQQLSSVLERDRKLLQDQLAAARALPAPVG